MKKLSFFLVAALATGCGTLVQRSTALNRQGIYLMEVQNISTPNDVLTLIPTTPEHISSRLEQLKLSVAKSLKAIYQIPVEKRTFSNTIQAFDDVQKQFFIAEGTIVVLTLVSPDETLQKAAQEAEQTINEFMVESFMNRELYRSFKEYVDGAMSTEQLSDAQKYSIEESMKDFKRSGFELPDKKFEQVKEIKKRVSKIGQDFSITIIKDDSALYVDESELTGLKPEFIKNLKRNESGQVRLGCDYPTRFEILGHCSNADVRKQYSKVYGNRAYPTNMKHLSELIDVRDELSSVLGYKNYAELDIDAVMAPSVKRVKEFLTGLASKVSDKLEQEMKTLKQDLPEGVELRDDGSFNPWDLGYVSKRYKKKHFNIDDRKIAEYFPLDKTIDGIFSIYQKLLGIKFEFSTPQGAWHESVRAITVRDAKDNSVLGFIFLDLHPRKNKFNHACMAPMVPAQFVTCADGSIKRLPAVCTVIANLPKQTAEKPALLKHSDVETFFHEFGHAMHHTLGATTLSEHGGTSVKWDFVEMPSQIFEEWMWDKEMLQMVSSHHKTGESLPEELIDSMLKLKKFDSGWRTNTQVNLALLSLSCYLEGKGKDTDVLRKKIYDEFGNHHVAFSDETHMQTAFGHLEGYGAKYYGYLWSKVFALDVFEQFKKNGLLDEATGLKFVQTILGRGGSADPNQLLVEFLGREPNDEAFIRDLGV